MLALQGAFADHARVLEASGARTRRVRTPADLGGLDGLVLPGGESTTMTLLLERTGLYEPLRQAVNAGLPTLGTCAGMILLARTITDGIEGQRSFGLLPITVRRNGYGRQLDSFEGDVQVEGIGPFPGVFIRAPVIEDTGEADIVARCDGAVVGVRHGAITALAFHPELSGDLRMHQQFVASVRVAQDVAPSH